MDFFGFISSAPRTKCANRGFTKSAVLLCTFISFIFYILQQKGLLDASSFNVDDVHEERTALMFLTVEEVNFDAGKREWQ